MLLLRKIALILVFVIVILAAIIFSLRNPAMLTIDWLFFEVTATAAMWIILSFISGGLLGMAVCAGLYARSKKNVYAAQRRASKTEAELNQLRATLVKE